MARTAIVPVTAVPAVAPDHASLADNVFSPDGGNAIEIFGKVLANTGSLYLLRNDGDADTEWYAVDLDATNLKRLQLDVAAPVGALAGFFSGVWLAGDLRRSGRASYVVLLIGTATFTTLYAAERAL